MTDDTQPDKARQRALRLTVLILSLFAAAFFISAFFKVWK
jgi:hypothetical protein